MTNTSPRDRARALVAKFAINPGATAEQLIADEIRNAQEQIFDDCARIVSRHERTFSALREIERAKIDLKI